MGPKARAEGAQGRPRRASAFGAASSHSKHLHPRRGKRVMRSAPGANRTLTLTWGQHPALGCTTEP
eukprot:scaffold92431_cov36-Phaeocystis_antarctica.AAC.1